MRFAIRRTCLLATVAVLLGGCVASPKRPVQADGTCCFRVGKTYRQKLTCTALPVPSDAIEADAKRFEPTPDAVTLYVVRRRWGDTANRVSVFIDEQPAVVTIPDSVVRVRLRPGTHQIVFEWQAVPHVKSVSARAGEVLFLEIDGSVRSWGSFYRWAEPDEEGALRRAASSKLVADINLVP